MRPSGDRLQAEVYNHVAGQKALNECIDLNDLKIIKYKLYCRQVNLETCVSTSVSNKQSTEYSSMAVPHIWSVQI